MYRKECIKTVHNASLVVSDGSGASLADLAGSDGPLVGCAGLFSVAILDNSAG